MSKTWTLKAENLFENIPGDDNNVNMTIPEEILKEKGWGPGTNLKVSWSDGEIILEEVTKEVDGKE